MGIFKAYDIRGKYPAEMDDEIAYRIGRAFVGLLKAKTIVVGRDCRLSSPALFEALCRGITSQGAGVIDIGLATTPILYFSTIKLKADGGVMITASHNPKEYNGFKLVRAKAVPVSGDTGIYAIEEMVKSGKFIAAGKKGKLTRKEMAAEYLKNEIRFVETAGIKPLKVVLDTANGMAGIVLPQLLKSIGCEVVDMFPELDGNFPNHQPDPMQEQLLEPLQKKVIKEKADLGIAGDGDFDRIKFIDDKGQVVQADTLTALLSKIMLSKHKGLTLMYDLRSSRIVKETIEANGGKALMYKVGHSFIKEKMAKEGIFFAGELSGHYYFKENGNIESPLIVTLYLLKYLSDSGKKLSEIVKPYRKYFKSEEINFEVEDKEKAMKQVENAFPGGKILRIDGVSIEFPDFWLNLRPSNTEPLLRLNAEANTKEKLEEIKKKVAGVLAG